MTPRQFIVLRKDARALPSALVCQTAYVSAMAIRSVPVDPALLIIPMVASTPADFDNLVASLTTAKVDFSVLRDSTGSPLALATSPSSLTDGWLFAGFFKRCRLLAGGRPPADS